MSKIFKNYQNPGYFLTLEEVRARVEDLTTYIRGNESYYRRYQTGILTKTQREEIILENEMKDEIDFYEEQICGFENEEDVKEYVNKIAASHFNNDEEEDKDKDKDKKPYYHIYDYCDPYLGKESPSIPDFDSYQEETQSRIDDLEKKMSGVQESVYQLVGGLFNQQTQSNVLESHINEIYCEEPNSQVDIGEESIWPTTRQGDANEEEIRLLKQQVSKLEGTVEMLVRVIKDQLGINIDISSL